MKLRSIGIALALVLGLAGCKGSKDDKNKKADPASAKVTTADTKTPADAKKPTTIPVTTKSEEARAAFLKGRSLSEEARLKDAIAPLKNAVELDPSFAQAHIYLAVVSPPKDADALRAKAVELSASLPEIERAFVVAMAEATGTDNSGAAAATDKLVTLAPDSWRALVYASGHVGMEPGNHAKAAKWLTRAAELNPTHAETYNMLAYIYQRQGKMDDAVKAATKQVELRPGNANPLDTLADMELAAGKLADAEAHYRKALDVDKTFTLAYTGIAATQILRNDLDGAAATYAEAAKADGPPLQKFFTAWNVVMVQALSGDSKGALKATAALLEVGNEAGLVGEASIAMGRARIHAHNGNWKLAHEATGEAVKAVMAGEAPDGQIAFTHLARTTSAARVGDKAAAEKAFAVLESKVKAGPVHTMARANLEWASGKTDEALATLESLKGTFQEMPALWAAADILAATKQPDKAKAKRDEIRKLHLRDIDSLMTWYQVSNAAE